LIFPPSIPHKTKRAPKRASKLKTGD